MPAEIGREQVRRLLQSGAQLIDVLPAKEYRREHLAGAIDIPLTTLDREATARLDRDRPVVVYCYDTQ
jgi:rhodanese-related sulfurtransferase